MLSQPIQESKKLSRLMQYLDGKAKEAVERYEGMGSGALLEALAILKTRFGQPYMIVDAFIIPELENAENDIMRMIQQHVFSEEYNALSKSGKVKISSSIAKLNPFIGENNIIRVGSRLEYAHISYNAKFPPILPKQHWVSELLARHVHCSNAHIGQEHTLNILRQRVWICNARSLVRKIINKCFICRRGHAPKLQQQMAPLPPCRVMA